MEGAIVLTGRVKDTIVLKSGENIEPQPIEVTLVAQRISSRVGSVLAGLAAGESNDFPYHAHWTRSSYAWSTGRS